MFKQKSTIFRPSSSVYFDLIRIGSAILVVFHHVWPVLFPGFPLPFPGHHAVVVFFVLSGFVIAYVADNKDRTIQDYALNRMSRLWSVAVPALLLALMAAPFVGNVQIAGAAPPATDIANALNVSMANMFFIGQN